MAYSSKTTYENTAENAQSVGFDRHPQYQIGEREYVFGDKTAKFVTHDHGDGTFLFHN